MSGGGRKIPAVQGKARTKKRDQQDDKSVEGVLGEKRRSFISRGQIMAREFGAKTTGAVREKKNSGKERSL